MRSLLTVGFVAILVAALAAPASAEIIFTGDGSPAAVGFEYLPGSGGSCVEPDGYTFDSPAGYMLQDTQYSNVISPRWGLDPNFVRADGWFIEVGVETLVSTGGGWGVCFGGGDELGGCYVTFETTAIAMNYAGWAVDKIPVTAGYHTVRVSMAPGGTTIDFDIDGTPIGSYAPNTDILDTVLFGDGSGSRLGKAEWDYVQVNAIPEPSTLALLGIGLGVLGFWRFRRR